MCASGSLFTAYVSIAIERSYAPMTSSKHTSTKAADDEIMDADAYLMENTDINGTFTPEYEFSINPLVVALDAEFRDEHDVQR